MKLTLLLHLHRRSPTFTISRPKCKYVTCFQTATGWQEAKLGVKVYFDVWASRGAWESPRARGGGVPRGNITGLFNWIFLFLIPASPLWIHGGAVQQTNAVSQGNHGRKEGFITQCRREKYQLLGAAVCYSVMENPGVGAEVMRALARLQRKD